MRVLLLLSVAMLLASAPSLAHGEDSFEQTVAKARVDAAAVPDVGRPWVKRTAQTAVAFDFGPVAILSRDGGPLPDPSAHLRRALRQMILVEESVKSGRIESLPGLANGLARMSAGVRKKLAALDRAIRAESQPPGAMGDMAMFAEIQVRAAFLDALWSWAKQAGVSLHYGEDDRGTVGPLPSDADFPKRAKAMEEPVQLSLENGELFYRFGVSVRSGWEPSEFAEPLLRAWSIADGITPHAKEPSSYQELLQKVQRAQRQVISHALQEARASKHGPKAQSLRLLRRYFQVRRVPIFQLWAWAQAKSVTLWPIADVPKHAPFTVTEGTLRVAVPQAAAVAKNAGASHRSGGTSSIRMKTKSSLLGKIQHVWFLDKWTWKTKPKFRPGKDDAWDDPAARPPEDSPWVDLVFCSDLVMGRRQHRMPGYVIVVGTKCSSGPIEVDLMTSDANKIFDHCIRKR